MCASYESKPTKEDISKLFDIQLPLFEFPFSFFPNQSVPIVRLNKDQPLFAFAGVWEKWQRGDNVIESCTLLTTTLMI
jgi:putative SOS response-associated peptidase YedK